MDSTNRRERNLSIDLERGAISSEQDRPRDGAAGDIQGRKLADRVWSGFLGCDRPARAEDFENSPNSPEASVENVGLLAERSGGGDRARNGGTMEMEKSKKCCKKPPKPPRPPSAILLDAADHKLIREISELSMLKRARIERMKALKKMKDAKTLFSGSSLCAMAVTIIFLIIIIMQGVSPRSSSNTKIQGSPVSAVASQGGLISIRYSGNIPASATGGPASGPPILVEPVSGSITAKGIRFSD